MEVSSLFVNSLEGSSSMSSEALILPVLTLGSPGAPRIRALKGEPHQTFFLDLCVCVFLKSKS